METAFRCRPLSTNLVGVENAVEKIACMLNRTHAVTDQHQSTHILVGTTTETKTQNRSHRKVLEEMEKSRAGASSLHEINSSMETTLSRKTKITRFTMASLHCLSLFLSA